MIKIDFIINGKLSKVYRFLTRNGVTGYTIDFTKETNSNISIYDIEQTPNLCIDPHKPSYTYECYFIQGTTVDIAKYIKNLYIEYAIQKYGVKDFYDLVWDKQVLLRDEYTSIAIQKTNAVLIANNLFIPN